MKSPALKPAHSDGHASSGFTLVELLVSLALLALLLAALPGTLKVGRRAWQSAAAHDQRTADMVVAGFLRERVSEAMPLFEKTNDGALRLAFRGEPHSVAFVSPLVDGPLGTGLFAFEIGQRNDVSGRSPVMLNWRPFSPGIEATASQRVLMPDVAAFDLRYFGYRPNSGKRDWAETWSDPQSLPELVELKLAPRGDAARPQVQIIKVMQRDVP